MTRFKFCFRLLLTVLMVSAGTLHFLRPAPFIKVVPDYLPHAPLLVAVSGFFEILGGIGLVVPKVRLWASWGLIALYISVFPANLNMAIHAERYPEFPPVALLIRLPLQALLIAWAWWVSRDSNEKS